MRPSSFLVAPLLLLSLSLAGCDRRARECEALRAVAEPAPLADAGLVDGARAVERTLAAIDAVEPRTKELAGVRGEYRAAVASLADAARKRDAVIREILDAAPPAGGAPGVVPGMGDALSQRFQALAEPCMGDMLGGLFKKEGATAPKPRPDCEKLGGVLLLAMRPAPGASVADHARSVTGALEAARLEEPALAEAARGLVAAVRQLDPLLAGVKIPAVELLALVSRFVEANHGVEEARSRAAEQAATVKKACPAR